MESIEDGLSLVYKCLNANCALYSQEIKTHLGYKTFELIRYCVDIPCCKNKIIENVELYVKNSYLSLKGANQSKKEKYEFSQNQEYFYSNYEVKDIAFLRISVTKLKPEYENPNLDSKNFIPSGNVENPKEVNQISKSLQDINLNELREDQLLSYESLVKSYADLNISQMKLKDESIAYSDIDESKCENDRTEEIISKNKEIISKNKEILWIPIGNNETNNRFEFQVFDSEIHLSEKASEIENFFYIARENQKFFYKNQQIYYVSKDQKFERNEFIDLIDFSERESVFFRVNFESKKKEYWVPMNNTQIMTVFDLLIKMRQMFNCRNYFRTQISLYSNKNQQVSFLDPLSELPDSILYIKEDNLELLKNILISYSNKSEFFSFDSSYELSKLKYQSSIFFNKHHQKVFFTSDSHDMTIDDKTVQYLEEGNIYLSDIQLPDPSYSLSSLLPNHETFKNSSESVIIQNGLNFLYHCQSNNCNSNEIPVFSKGLGNFNFQHFELRCITCNSDLLNIYLVLSNCRYMFKYTESDDVEKTEGPNSIQSVIIFPNQTIPDILKFKSCFLLTVQFS